MYIYIYIALHIYIYIHTRSTVFLVCYFATTAWHSNDQAQSAATQYAPVEPLLPPLLFFFFFYVMVYIYIYLHTVYIYIYTYTCVAQTLLQLYVHIYICIYCNIYISYIYIFINTYRYIWYYTFVRVTMPYTPTSFRLPSLWPQVINFSILGTHRQLSTPILDHLWWCQKLLNPRPPLLAKKLITSATFTL